MTKEIDTSSKEVFGNRLMPGADAKTSIYDLPIPKRLATNLDKSGIATLDNLRQQSRLSLMMTKGVSRKYLTEILRLVEAKK